MAYHYIKVEKNDFRFVLTLARPEKRNAFTPTMVNEIAHAFKEANEDDRVKIVVIKAEGPVFCAGMDLKTFENPEADVRNPQIQNKEISLGEVFDSLVKPSIAIVEGDVIAGAFLIVLGCTYVYCAREVRFRLPELGLGIFPFQVMASLLKVMPEKKVLQLCLQTDYFSAWEAREWDIVDAYLDEVDVEERIAAFGQINVKALQAGIRSFRVLPDIPQADRFAFLMKALGDLKKDG